MSDTPATPSTEAVDPTILEGLRAFGGMPLLTQLVGLYREQVRIRLAAIDTGLADGDTDAIRQAAHALKGSSGQVGATRLQALCGEVERLASDAALDRIPAVRSAIATAVASVDQWLVDRGFPH